MTLEAGTQIGDYEILGVAGIGGMGAVYRARNLISQRIDAMKVIAQLGGLPDLGERFLREIQVQARLRHPNIASLYTAFRFQDQLIMVMEYVEGGTVEARLMAGPMGVTLAADCITQVLAALEYAHGLGVVHRDVKPANIAITPDGAVKLLDFGIARDLRDPSLTVTGAAIGSLYYMSPEQVAGQALDARSDLYSVGLTLYEMLTGRRAVSGENSYAVMQAQLGVDPVPPADVDPALSRALSDVVVRAIAKKRELRFQTAAEFRGALEPFRAGATAGPGPIVAAGAFPADLLARLEKELAQFVGPIARHLVRNVARGAGTLPDLCSQLALELPAEAERRAFLRACAGELGADALSETGRRALATTAPPPPPPAWDPAVLERARAELAAHIGPLARVIVERAARAARSVDELYTMLSSEITSDRGREAFLAGRPRGANQ